MESISERVCSICGERLGNLPAPAEVGEIRCVVCQKLEPPYAKASAYGSYEGGLRELIQLLKYQRVRPAANVLGRMLAEAIDDLQPFFATNPIVIPVPLHHRKLRERGFNQSEKIAGVALKLLRAKCSLRLEPGLMERRRETQSQTGLSRHQRRENIRGAFVLTEPGQVKGHDIILIDDVFTTGTTVSECARVLRRAGASNVYVATVARTLKAQAQAVKIGSESHLEIKQELAMAAAR